MGSCRAGQQETVGRGGKVGGEQERLQTVIILERTSVTDSDRQSVVTVAGSCARTRGGPARKTGGGQRAGCR